MSKPDGPGVILANIVLVSHFGQGGRKNMEHGASPWIRREHYKTLSHRWSPLWPVMKQYEALQTCFAGQYSSHVKS
jgi:hypothetical protein